MAVDIKYYSLLYFLVLFIPIFFIMKKLKLPLIPNTSRAVTRMIVQLFLVGFYLQYIFRLNDIWVNIAYIFLMTAVGVYTVSRDVPIREMKIFGIIFMAMGVPLVLNLFVFNVLALRLSNPFDAMYLIPITGMILGNTLNGMVVGLNDFLKTFTKDEEEYFLSLSLGATKSEAVRPYIAQSVSLSIKPNIASMATLGLVALPGMMTGQILGGSLPMTAIKYQIAVMLGIFVARFFSTYILLELISINYFDKFSVFDRRIKNNYRNS